MKKPFTWWVRERLNSLDHAWGRWRGRSRTYSAVVWASRARVLMRNIKLEDELSALQLKLESETERRKNFFRRLVKVRSALDKGFPGFGHLEEHEVVEILIRRSNRLYELEREIEATGAKGGSG